MRLLIALLMLSGVAHADTYVSVACGRTLTDPIVCVLSQAPTKSSQDPAITAITDASIKKCQQSEILDCRFFVGYTGGCHAMAATLDGRTSQAWGYDVEQARITAFNACNSRYQTTNCHGVYAFCAQ